MILTTEAIVLSRRPMREYDRITNVYTRAFGKIAARFIGVDRPKGKLKALSEPMVHAEFRLYARFDGRMSTVTGGRLITSHPGLRRDLPRTVAGLEMCELMLRLTPYHSPSERKFDLIRDFLSALEDASSPWFSLAFGLRLMRLAGFSLEERDVFGADRALWDRLHEADVFTLQTLSEDASRRGRLQQVLERAVEYESGSMLNSRAFRESVAREYERTAAAAAGEWDSRQRRTSSAASAGRAIAGGREDGGRSRPVFTGY